MTRLSDTQLVILSTACQSDDRLALPLPNADWREPASLDDVDDHREGIEAYRDAARLAGLPEDFWKGQP